MPGLVPGIHVLAKLRKQAVDGRVKPGQARPWRCGWIDASHGWY